LLQHNIPLFTFDIITAVLLVLNLFDIRIRKKYQFNICVGIFFVSIFYILLYITGGINGTAVVWYFTYPLIASYLLGSSRGGIATILMTIPVLTMIFIDPKNRFFADYNINFEIRFLASYIVVCFFSYLFENTREKNREELNSINQSLEKIIIDRTSELTKTNKQLMREIEERKRAHKAMRLSQESLMTVLDSMDATVYVADMESYEILFMNKYMKEIFGRDMTGERCWSAFRNKSGPCRNCTNDKLIDNRKQPTDGYIWQDRNPITEKWYINHDRAIKWIDGRLVRIQIAVDITEHKKMEKELRKSQKLEALGTLAARVAHDLNNILSGIVSYPELLLLDLPEDSHLRKPLETIQKSGIKASEVVQDLMAIARRGIKTPEVVDLRLILNEYLDSPEHSKIISLHPNVEFITQFEDDLMNIKGSPFHLFQAIMNIISNAAEAMPHGGMITIVLKNEYVDTRIHGFDQIDEGEYVVLSVKDTGEGMSDADIEHIFEPFYSKKVMGRSGTGLGMSIVLGVVKDHHGHIVIDSTVGKGTQIKIYFPTTRELAKEINSERCLADLKGNGEKILLVDDVAEQLEIASGILNRLGYRVVTVSSGEEAIEYLKLDSVDLLILDMIMDPGIDGLETYRQCLEIRPHQKAIIASGYSESERVKHAQKLGAGAYIRKPYTIEKLGRAILNELRSEDHQLKTSESS